ncbi:unnamed protein product [Schistosoma intercalatum]|nr:unnamed protein product [Schistosoma intercalatum]
MISHNLVIYSIITICILTVHYVNCAGILWGDHSTDTTTTYIKTTTKASRPVTEKQGPFIINDENIFLMYDRTYSSLSQKTTETNLYTERWNNSMLLCK